MQVRPVDVEPVSQYNKRSYSQKRLFDIRGAFFIAMKKAESMLDPAFNYADFFGSTGAGFPSGLFFAKSTNIGAATKIEE